MCCKVQFISLLLNDKKIKFLEQFDEFWYMFAEKLGRLIIKNFSEKVN